MDKNVYLKRKAQLRQKLEIDLATFAATGSWTGNGDE